jgi:3-deoxy-D-manno-octulosonate 8-phosphate phosphatase (KDO 8-P phosphatase)
MQANQAETEKKMKQIKTFLFDVDGVFTDGSILLMPTGELLRKMSTRDGYAVQYAILQGYRVGIITGGSLQAIRIRFEGLGVPSSHIFLNIRDKKSVYEEFILTHQLKSSEILFMGDDIPDYAVMRNSGLAACPKNAVSEILSIADYISDYNGGEGSVRQVIETVLHSQGKWDIHTHIQSI